MGGFWRRFWNSFLDFRRERGALWAPWRSGIILPRRNGAVSVPYSDCEPAAAGRSGPQWRSGDRPTSRSGRPLHRLAGFESLEPRLDVCTLLFNTSNHILTIVGDYDEAIVVGSDSAGNVSTVKFLASSARRLAAAIATTLIPMAKQVLMLMTDLLGKWR
jgi:hypothetical protein